MLDADRQEATQDNVSAASLTHRSLVTVRVARRRTLCLQTDKRFPTAMHAETDSQLRFEADQLLASGLQKILSDFGEVHVVGSYALHLMAWRDLDIHVVCNTLEPLAFFDLGAKIALLLKPPRMHYRDETVVATPGLPRGLYWGVYLGDERKGAWKIDIWMSGPEVFQSIRTYGEQLAARLSESSRSAILMIKSGCWDHPAYRRRFSSGDIYSAVLDHGVTDIDGFWAFLKGRNCAV